jgi:hypothetical protein
MHEPRLGIHPPIPPSTSSSSLNQSTMYIHIYIFLRRWCPPACSCSWKPWLRPAAPPATPPVPLFVRTCHRVCRLWIVSECFAQVTPYQCQYQLLYRRVLGCGAAVARIVSPCRNGAFLTKTDQLHSPHPNNYDNCTRRTIPSIITSVPTSSSASAAWRSLQRKERSNRFSTVWMGGGDGGWWCVEQMPWHDAIGWLSFVYRSIF